MTNEERRRASGAAMEASRRGSGAAMEASRTGKSVADDIQSLVQPPRQAKPLPRIDPVGALPASQGRGVYKAPSGGGGIASPLTEQPDTREYFDPVTMPSSDGLLWAQWRPVKRLVMKDANDNDVTMEFLDVTPPA